MGKKELRQHYFSSSQNTCKPYATSHSSSYSLNDQTLAVLYCELSLLKHLLTSFKEAQLHYLFIYLIGTMHVNEHL